MLYLIGLGLSDETDITVKGLEIVRKAARVYLENYTAILLVETKVLEEYYGRPVIVADREMVESDSDSILKGAETEDVAFLVVGDPYGNNTHRPHHPRARALHPHNLHPQRLDHVRHRRRGTPALQLRANRVHGVLHRFLETDVVLRPREGEPQYRAAHAGAARYQGQGAESGEYGEGQADL
ncbi:hypothetical protein V494_06900 [Pseudogymnoascus sp. VKM F-4513 (FW-928)]|nr:hypothetical protein V494_06900 [Pseudogymnoascus sp. VKM F-4513 (FW-928)]